MSSESIALRVSDVGKCFHVYRTPRDRLKQFVLPRLSRMIGQAPTRHYSEFWALRDVSFEVGRGETVGIIGRNGSGKSTLLQIICGTLAASTGVVETHGRIAALLELGSGFDPEFTGRENVFMNAGLLGLDRRTTEERFDRIAAFADIGPFLDQPVKTYSSGMFVRLAFSVAMHVDPEILIVDEALSVGDAFFQAKCADAMRRLMDGGATILFVSHDVTAIKSMCDRAVLLEGGRLQHVGTVNETIERYYSSLIGSQQAVSVPGETARRQAAAGAHAGTPDAIGDTTAFDATSGFQRIRGGHAEFLNVSLLDEAGRPVEVAEYGQTVRLRQVIRVLEPIPRLALAYHVRDRNGLDLVYADTGLGGDRDIVDATAGDVFAVEWTFRMRLRDGHYTIASMASQPHDRSAGAVTVADFVPISAGFGMARSRDNPLYGATAWDNELVVARLSANGGTS